MIGVTGGADKTLNFNRRVVNRTITEELKQLPPRQKKWGGLPPHFSLAQLRAGALRGLRLYVLFDRIGHHLIEHLPAHG